MKSKARRRYYLAGPNRQIADTVIKLLSNEPAGTLLDAGAGNGYLSGQLFRLGMTVSACDIEPKQFLPCHIKIKYADFGRRLPYRTASFDYAVCIEVIEHLENPWHILRELRRILKRNGRLIISLPNFSNLISRLVFFARGNFRYFDDWAWQNWGHINPVTYTELHHILNKVGFRVIAINTQQTIEQPYAQVIHWLQQAVSLIFGTVKMLRWRQDPKDKTLNRLETTALLFGENIILKCRKL